MSAFIDYVLVALTVGLAAAYLIRRKIRKRRRLDRDWTSGRVDACDSCPVIEIRRRQKVH
jgi:hypothetical protein